MAEFDYETAGSQYFGSQAQSEFGAYFMSDSQSAHGGGVGAQPHQSEDVEDEDEAEMGNEKYDMFGGGDYDKSLDKLVGDEDADNDVDLDAIENILDLPDTQFPKFTLAKNKARFLRMVSWYRQKEEWIEVAPLSGVTKLFKQQSKELEGIRASKMDYEMELETGTLTPSQRSYRKDELKMCRVQEKMAVHLIAKLQIKIKSGRR